ncbi:hypothetical protein BCR34DRAFT_308044 [Clohesyomyces aquaticus]|uniref:Uncharacterized protein n=1 Tax=Clohesyomyces aquaticus TaxID=1231657 RepID=A0A1Y1ZQ16_9PLEO|nr:hypothetical protein BCR34DRAFT_308044 [Clohesyomyces aquaticus]
MAVASCHLSLLSFIGYIDLKASRVLIRRTGVEHHTESWVSFYKLKYLRRDRFISYTCPTATCNTAIVEGTKDSTSVPHNQPTKPSTCTSPGSDRFYRMSLLWLWSHSLLSQCATKLCSICINRYVRDESEESFLESGSTPEACTSTRPKHRSPLEAFLRTLKLQITPELTQWSAPTERPKVALHRDRSISALLLLLHIPPRPPL